MVRQPPKSKLLTHSIPNRRSSDLGDRLDEVRARFEHLAGADPDFTVIENSGLTDFVDGTDAETKAGPAGDRGSADGNDMCNFTHGILRVGIKISRRWSGCRDCRPHCRVDIRCRDCRWSYVVRVRSEEHTSELQSLMRYWY